MRFVFKLELHSIMYCCVKIKIDYAETKMSVKFEISRTCLAIDNKTCFKQFRIFKHRKKKYFYYQYCIQHIPFGIHGPFSLFMCIRVVCCVIVCVLLLLLIGICLLFQILFRFAHYSVSDINTVSCVIQFDLLISNSNGINDGIMNKLTSIRVFCGIITLNHYCLQWM